MPLVASFSTTQNVGLPSQIVITDTSTGTDVSVTQRRVYLAKSDGKFLKPANNATDYIVWSINNSTITIDALDKDYALNITVQWLNTVTVSGVVIATVLYNASNLAGFTLYNETFDYGLTQLLSGNPMLIDDDNIYTNKSDLRTDIDSGNQAIQKASDIFGAQQCYDRGTNKRLQSQYYFNANS